MRIFLTAVFAVCLFACDADTPNTSESSKEKVMLGKGSTESYVIFSPMEGVLMKGGKPLANAKITRRLRWNGNDEEGLLEEFTTDDQGYFSLPVHEEELSLGMLAQFVSSAKLETEIEGHDVDMWYNNKFEGHLYAETNGKISGLVCDIENEEIVVKAGLSKIMTICRWAEMPESE